MKTGLSFLPLTASLVVTSTTVQTKCSTARAPSLWLPSGWRLG